MRALLISDIHGNLPALNAVLNKAGVVDKIICIGDLGGYFPFVNEVIETIASLDNVVCVAGNHDRSLISEISTGSKSADMALAIQRKIIKEENKDYLKSLPEIIDCELNGRLFFIFHGSPTNPFEGRDHFWESDLKPGVYLFGHLHRTFYKNDPDKGLTFICPGSCGFPRDGDPRASYAVLDTESMEVDFCRVEYPTETVRLSCEKAGLPDNFYKGLLAGVWIGKG